MAYQNTTKANHVSVQFEHTAYMYSEPGRNKICLYASNIPSWNDMFWTWESAYNACLSKARRTLLWSARRGQTIPKTRYTSSMVDQSSHRI